MTDLSRSYGLRLKTITKRCDACIEGRHGSCTGWDFAANCDCPCGVFSEFENWWKQRQHLTVCSEATAEDGRNLSRIAWFAAKGLNVPPTHLFPGNQAINMADMKAKGRARGGRVVGIPYPKVNAELRLVIAREREAGSSQRTLAAKYGLSAPGVRYILKRVAAGVPA